MKSICLTNFCEGNLHLFFQRERTLTEESSFTFKSKHWIQLYSKIFTEVIWFWESGITLYNRKDDTKQKYIMQRFQTLQRKGLGWMDVVAEQTEVLYQSNHCCLLYVWKWVQRNEIAQVWREYW